MDHVLEIGGVPKTAKVKLLRHVPREATPEAAWKSKWLHEYERMHGADFKVPEYFVTFIPIDRARARFLWVKKIIGCKERGELAHDPTYTNPPSS